MTIRKGEQWGSLLTPSTDVVLAGSDLAIRVLLDGGRDAGATPAIGLVGGDLMRTLGGTGDAARFSGDAPIPHLPVDLIHVVADDDRAGTFVAHLVARNSWWRGEVTAVMNAQFRGNWDVAPRSHPNDGRIDVVAASEHLRIRQRWMARARLRLGTHVPHPQISVRQMASASITFARPTSLWLDGERWGSATTLRIRVEPDAFIVCV